MSTAHEYSDTRTGAGGGFGFDKEFMTTLAKGLAVLSSFGEQRQRMTLSEAAEVTGLSRAASRRPRPRSWRSFANSTIRMPFFAIRPIRVIRPTWV